MSAAMRAAPPPPDDAVFSVDYSASAGALSLAEVLPLIRSVRGTILGARSLRATDLVRSTDAGGTPAPAPLLRLGPITAVQDALSPLLLDQQAFLGDLDAAVGDGIAPETARTAAAAGVDSWLTRYFALVAAGAPFGRPVRGTRLPRSTGVEPGFARWWRI